MAYNFVAASSQYLSTASTPVTAVPITMFTRFARASNGLYVNIAVVTVAGTSRLQNYISDTAGGQWFALSANTGGGFAQAIVQNFGITNNVWYAHTGVYASNTSRTVYANASTNATTDANSNVLGTPDAINIGARVVSNVAGTFFDGNLADAAIWNAALTADEVDSLAKGFKPTRIRPQSLVFYAPLIRDLQDFRGGLTITNNNTATVADHPRVY